MQHKTCNNQGSFYLSGVLSQEVIRQYAEIIGGKVPHPLLNLRIKYVARQQSKHDYYRMNHKRCDEQA